VVAALQVEVLRGEILDRGAERADTAPEPVGFEVLDDGRGHALLRLEGIAAMRVDRLGPQISIARRVHEVDRGTLAVRVLSHVAADNHGRTTHLIVELAPRLGAPRR